MAVIIIDTEAKEIREADETFLRITRHGERYEHAMVLKRIHTTVLKPLNPRAFPGVRPDQVIVIVGRDYFGDQNGEVWAAVTVREMRDMIRKFQELMRYAERGR